MSTFVFHAAFVIALVSVYPLISGRTAEAVHREAKMGGPLKWFLVGGITDLRALKLFHRCLGIVLVPIIIVVYVAALYHS